MHENTFSDFEVALTQADLNHFESAIGKTLPTAFQNHCLKYNGGIPERAYWYSEDFFDPAQAITARHRPLTGPLQYQGAALAIILPIAMSATVQKVGQPQVNH